MSFVAAVVVFGALSFAGALIGDPLPMGDEPTWEGWGPSPFSDHFWIDLHTGEADLVEVVLYDLMGRPVWSASTGVDRNVFRRLWLGDGELSGLSSGTYVVQVRAGGRSIQRKLTKAIR